MPDRNNNTIFFLRILYSYLGPRHPPPPPILLIPMHLDQHHGCNRKLEPSGNVVGRAYLMRNDQRRRRRRRPSDGLVSVEIHLPPPPSIMHPTYIQM